jgi:response regulator RpfG family c-di-GMP phosphodiesterase
MLTIEIIGVLLFLLGLLIYSTVRTMLQRREAELLGRAERMARILLVDDDPDSVKITKRILDSHGYTVEKASWGSEALSMKRSGSVKPGLVLPEMMMDHPTHEFVDDLAWRTLCVSM